MQVVIFFQKNSTISAQNMPEGGQVVECIKSLKPMLKKYKDTNDPHIALLQIRSTPLGQGLLSPATLLFMLILNRPPANTDNDDEHEEALVQRQVKAGKN